MFLTCGALPHKQGLGYLIWINFFFLKSGIILSHSIVKSPSFKFASPTFTSSSILNDLVNLNGWPEKVKLMQKNWIGKSYGGEIIFKIERI